MWKGTRGASSEKYNRRNKQIESQQYHLRNKKENEWFVYFQSHFVPQEANSTTREMEKEGRKYASPIFWIEKGPKSVERNVEEERKGHSGRQ